MRKKNTKYSVGIIGCGTIGSELARLIRRNFSSLAAVRFVCDHHLPKAVRLKRKLGPSCAVVSMRELIDRSDLVIEAASAAVSADVALHALAKGKQVLVMSVGGLIRTLPRVLKACRGNGKLWIPSGAIAGIDGVLASREGRIRRVKLITQKPPRSLESAPYFRKKRFPRLTGRRPVCLFRGSAAEAVKHFPQNINVAAVLSLAGLGARKTSVEIWTAKSLTRNCHRIRVESDAGVIETSVENVPAPGNPKTSYLAILSAAATIRKIFSACELGT